MKREVGNNNVLMFIDKTSVRTATAASSELEATRTCTDVARTWRTANARARAKREREAINCVIDDEHDNDY